jgi:hypothetical protein
MNRGKNLLPGLLAVALAAVLTAPAGATSLRRAGLEELVAANATVVVGEVLDVNSRWNDDGSFILTDVRVAVSDVLKGNPKERELTFTVLGGTVGELTTLIVGGAELVPGNTYVLFLNPQDLPGAKAVRTVRDHSQGVFDLVIAGDGLRAVSQASRQPLMPDAKGLTEPPGGAKGLLIANLMQSIRELAARPQSSRREVQ